MRASRVTAVLYCCALAAVLLAPGTTNATPVPRRFFGISPFHPLDFPPLPMGTVGHPTFVWPAVESVRDSFNFTIFDELADEAVARGMIDTPTNTVHMAITLGLTPSWATSHQETCTRGGGLQCSAPPDNIVDWKNFLLALIHHFNGVDHPHVHYYELWNEADDSIWFTPTIPDSFSQMLQLAVAADSIIHLDPHSLLLTPSVTGKVSSMVTWMSDYLRAGGAAHADGGALHGYIGGGTLATFPFPESDATQGSIITKVTDMRAVFDNCGLAGKPMFQTEGSWGNFNETDPDTMAAWLARWELLQAGMRASNDLQLAVWFAWADSAFGWGDLETQAGTPNKAGIAYEQIYNWVVGASMDTACTQGTNGGVDLRVDKAGRLSRARGVEDERHDQLHAGRVVHALPRSRRQYHRDRNHRVGHDRHEAAAVRGRHADQRGRGGAARTARAARDPERDARADRDLVRGRGRTRLADRDPRRAGAERAQVRRGARRGLGGVGRARLARPRARERRLFRAPRGARRQRHDEGLDRAVTRATSAADRAASAASQRRRCDPAPGFQPPGGRTRPTPRR